MRAKECTTAHHSMQWHIQKYLDHYYTLLGRWLFHAISDLPLYVCTWSHSKTTEGIP